MNVRKLSPVLFGLLCARILTGCGGGTGPTVPGPTVLPPITGSCGFSVEQGAANKTVSADGGEVQIPVAAQAGCNWTASTQNGVDFITITDGQSGTGQGTVKLAVKPNTGGSRSGGVTVAGVPFTVAQQAASCSFALSGDTSPTFGPAGGTLEVKIAVTQGAGCTWTAAVSGSSFFTVSPTSGTGDGSVKITAVANPGDTRSGTMTVAGQTLTVRQASGLVACVLSAAPSSIDVAAVGGSSSVTVTQAQAGNCPWTVSVDADWIKIPSGPTGAGSGSVSIQVDANTGGARTATLTVAGQSVAIRQAAASGPGPNICAFTVAPLSVVIPSGGGSLFTLTVTQTQGQGNCAWSAAADVPWVTFTSPQGGAGNGTVTFSVDANTGTQQRSGTITFAGQRVSVAQPAPGSTTCAFSVFPTTVSPDAAGGSSFTITATQTQGPTCTWTATVDVPWITFTTATNGSGTGSVTFRVDANTGPSRTGTITFAGQRVTVTQAAVTSTSCTFSVAPTTVAVDAAGGAGFNLTATPTQDLKCAWTAVADVSWITFSTATSGTGAGTVTFRVDVNTGAARTGTVTFAGQRVTVTQAAGTGCTFSVFPTTVAVDAAGGSSFTATATPTQGTNCAWTAAADVPWITFTTATSGTGSGSVTFRVDANTGAARTGTITFAGQRVTVNQAAPAAACTFSVAPTSISVTTAGSSGTSLTATQTQGSNCAWTATGDVSWITFTTATSGTGTGTVTFRVDANATGKERVGTVTFAGQRVTVTQGG